MEFTDNFSGRRYEDFTYLEFCEFCGVEPNSNPFVNALWTSMHLNSFKIIKPIIKPVVYGPAKNNG